MGAITMRHILLIALLLLLPAQRAVADAQTQKWWAEERKCIADCPKMPRFGGTETDAQFKKRIKQTEAYNQCRRKCIKTYMDKVQLKHNPFDDGSKGYFKRNK
jgi:hypothetical protein